MVILDIEAIKLSEVLDRISFYSDDAFKIALQNTLIEKISKSISKQLDCFDIVIKTYMSYIISFADIINLGGLSINDINITFKTKEIDNTIEIKFPNKYKNGYYSERDKKYIYSESMSDRIEPIIQKRAIKYKKRIQYIIISSEKFINNINNCSCETTNLYPIRKTYFVLWYCCVCGKKYFCSCFQKAIKAFLDTPDNNSDKDELKTDLQNATFRDNICHLCRKIPASSPFWLHSNNIIGNYSQYIMREYYEKEISYREAENNIREELNIPKIGEGWVSQTKLYYTIKFLFPEYEILREASPEWLGRQRYDIYFPNEKLAIEYQGKQHYEPVNLFGGEEGYKNTIERDKEKLKKSKENGVDIIYISHKDKIDENTLYKRIKKYLENK